MGKTLVGIFFILHGLVHMWYFVLARKLVPFKAVMGWSGRSWLFTNLIGDEATRILASILLVLVTVGLVSGGVGFLSGQAWARSLLLVSAAASALVLAPLWDGSMQLIVQKGLIGMLIDVGIVVMMLMI